MVSKIFAGLKDGNQVILFDENSEDYGEVVKLFEYNIENIKPISFVDNMRSILSDDEIFFIEISDDDENNFFSNIKINTNSVDHNLAKENDYPNIEVIYLVNDSAKTVLLKKIYPVQRIGGGKKYLICGEKAPSYKEESNKINLSLKVHVYYDINKKTFYFENFKHLTDIFKNAVKYYKEATKEEIVEYFSEDFFELDESILDNIPNNLRKRLGILIDKNIDFSDKELMEKYEKYAEEYNIKMPEKNEEGKYVLKYKTRLKDFVKILEEVIYETPVSNEKREVDNYRNLQTEEGNY